MLDDLSGAFSRTYPSDLRNGGGLAFDKFGLTVRGRLDYSQFQQVDTPPRSGFVAVQDPSTLAFYRFDIATLQSATFPNLNAVSVFGNAFNQAGIGQNIAFSDLIRILLRVAGQVLPTSPDGLSSGEPWRNGDGISFVP